MPGERASLIDEWPGEHVSVIAVGAAGAVASAGDPAHRFRVASVTKAVFATAVMIAVEERALTLDQPAGPPGSTVRHLLSHASGLDSEEPVPLTAVAQRRIYSNAGFEELGRALEAATGLTAAEYLDEAILQPLGMTDSHLGGSPAHGLVTTAGDLGRWVQELLRPTLLDPSSVLELRTPQFPELNGVLPGFGQQHPNLWGLGVEIRGEKSPHWTGVHNSPETFGHFGRTGAFVWIDPVARLGLVGLGDCEFGAWAADLWPVLSDAALREFAEPAPASPSQAEAAAAR